MPKLTPQQYNAQLKPSADLKAALAYWPSPQSASFTYLVKRFQKAAGETVDGYFGPDTQKALLEEHGKPRPDNYLIIDSVRYEVHFPVINYEQDENWSLYPSKNFGWREREVELFILHWDVTTSSERTHEGFLRESRDASSHLYLKADGTYIQTLDLGFVRAWHAGSNGGANARSIGCEGNNPYYLKYQSKTNPRPVVRPRSSQGNPEVEHLDWYPIQRQRMVEMGEFLVTVPHLSIPRQLPKRPHWESEFLGDDKDTAGSVIRGELRQDQIKLFKGIAGHLHFEEMKIDPSLLPFDDFIAAGW